MNKLERQNQLREIFSSLHRAEVKDLSKSLGVSEATIRTDLESLEEEGFLTRFHGGALINKKGKPDDEPAGLIVPYEECKEQIGIIAASLINNYEGVFLGPGSTCYFIALALRKRTDITINVVTNSFLIASVLGDYPHIRLHFIGGRVQNRYTVSEDLNKDLQDIYLDKMFFSIDGIDPGAGYTLSDAAVHEVILTVARRTKMPIMAADVSKFGRRSFMKIGGMDFTPAVVTTPDIPELYLNYYKERRIKVFTSPRDNTLED